MPGEPCPPCSGVTRFQVAFAARTTIGRWKSTCEDRQSSMLADTLPGDVLWLDLKRK